LEAVLQRLLVVVLVGRVLQNYGVVSFADLTPLLGLGLPLLWDLDFLGGGGDSETNFFKSSCKKQLISTTTHMEWVLDSGYEYLPPLAGARQSTPVRGTPCTAACP
jgi:hypothetical protein